MPIVPFIKALWPIPGCVNLTTYIQGSSDYEILCTVLEKLNDVIASFNSLDEAVTELSSKYDTLEQFVNDYFENLDVQAEINNKLDQMLADGSLEEIISKNLSWYVMADSVLTPGLDDYSEEIENVINTYGSVVFSNKTYNVNSLITINRSNVHIIGNNCTFLGSNTAFNSLFNVKAGVENVKFEGVNFVCGTSVADPEPGNYCLTFSAPTSYDENLISKNISIVNCSFFGGNVSVSFNVCRNILVSGTTFKNARQGSTAMNSGYNILEQSCENFIVENCVFTDQRQVRHCIYVSINQSYEPKIQSKNVKISNCIFDSSEQEYYAIITSQINVRSVNECVIENCSFTGGTGISAVSGDIDDVLSSITITRCSFDNMHYMSASIKPYESRNCINLNFQSPPLSAVIAYNSFNSADNSNFNTTSLGKSVQAKFIGNNIGDFGPVIHVSDYPCYFSNNYKTGSNPLISIQKKNVNNGFISWDNDAPNGNVISFSGGSIHLGVIDPRYVQYNMSYSGGTYNLARANTHKVLSLIASYESDSNSLTLSSSSISDINFMISNIITYVGDLYVARKAASQGSITVSLHSNPERTKGYKANFAFTLLATNL